MWPVRHSLLLTFHFPCNFRTAWFHTICICEHFFFFFHVYIWGLTGANIRRTHSIASSNTQWEGIEGADFASGPVTQWPGFIYAVSFSCIIMCYMRRWLVDVHNAAISRSRGSVSSHQRAPVPLLWLVAGVTDKNETFDKHIQEPSILVWA